MALAMHPHQIEELEHRDGPALWDASPDVCCAAFQLGACLHTEDAIAEMDDYFADQERIAALVAEDLDLQGNLTDADWLALNHANRA